MKWFFTFVLVLNFGCITRAQTNIQELDTPTPCDNVCMALISHDSLQSNFVIWVKKLVPLHYHTTHTETIVVLEGSALMLLNGQEITINKGDFVVIPPNTEHGVLQVTSIEPLKVLSTQAPYFDGSDRVLVKDKKEQTKN